MPSAAAPVQVSVGEELQLHCLLPFTFPPTFNLTWSFRNSHAVLSVSVQGPGRQAVEVSECWRPHVAEVAEVGEVAGKSLVLWRLEAEHNGSFTCEVLTLHGRYVTWTDVTVVRGEAGEEEEEVQMRYEALRVKLFLCKRKKSNHEEMRMQPTEALKQTH